LYFGIILVIKEIQTSFKRWNWVWYGLIFGYAAMVRTHAIVMPAVVGCAYIYAKFPKRQIILSVVGIFIVMQAINLPWVIRNYRAWKVPVIYTATGNFVYSQLNASARGKGGGRIPGKGEEGFSEEVDEARISGNPGIMHKACTKAAFQWCIGHPGQCFILGVEKILEFMGVNRRGVWPIWFQYYQDSYDKSRPINDKLKHFFEEIAYFGYYFLFFNFIFGLILIFRKWKHFNLSSKKAIFVILSVIGFYLLEHFFIYADRKYRYPIEPLMMVFVCMFLDYLYFNLDLSKLICFFKKGVKNAEKST
jgi:hypothetical protein